jgi:LacI family transcriptional regulator
VVVLITIKDIAREAGVSTATVSYVINGTRPVLPEKRNRVLEVIAKTDYQPNRVAKSLRTKKTNIIGVLAEDILSFPTTRIINGISEYVENTSYQILLYDLRMLDSLFNQYDQLIHNSDKINKALSLLVNGANVDAVIYVGMFDRDISGIIKDIEKPFVIAYSTSQDEHSYSVSYENVDISTELARQVIDCGHERIAVITGLAHTTPAQKRMKGITNAFREAGFILDSALVKYGDWERKTGYSCMNDLLQQESEALPTAVIAMNDLMAIGAMDAIRDAGLRVPHDISVVGFDNREVSEFVYPKLSTVEIDLEEIGRKATELTNKLLNKDSSIPENHSILIPSRLVLRDTLQTLSGF